MRYNNFRKITYTYSSVYIHTTILYMDGRDYRIRTQGEFGRKSCYTTKKLCSTTSKRLPLFKNQIIKTCRTMIKNMNNYMIHRFLSMKMEWVNL